MDQVLEMLRSALINFENVEKMAPPLQSHPIYKIAKLQLMEAIALLEKSPDEP